MIITLIQLLVSILICHPAFACINLPTLPPVFPTFPPAETTTGSSTTATTSASCKQLGQSCQSEACCDGLACAPLISLCVPAVPTITGRKKRSDGGCEGLTSLEMYAFTVCEADGQQGLTWAEVEQCEDKFADTDFSMPPPSFEDFTKFDVNGDGVLTMEEWKSVTG